jgi:hypothetical protein
MRRARQTRQPLRDRVRFAVAGPAPWPLPPAPTEPAAAEVPLPQPVAMAFTSSGVLELSLCIRLLVPEGGVDIVVCRLFVEGRYERGMCPSQDGILSLRISVGVGVGESRPPTQRSLCH